MLYRIDTRLVQGAKGQDSCHARCAPQLISKNRDADAGALNKGCTFVNARSWTKPEVVKVV